MRTWLRRCSSRVRERERLPITHEEVRCLELAQAPGGRDQSSSGRRALRRIILLRSGSSPQDPQLSLLGLRHSARKCSGFGAGEGDCNPVKVTRPELPIEGDILRTQTRELGQMTSCGNRNPANTEPPADLAIRSVSRCPQSNNATVPGIPHRWSAVVDDTEGRDDADLRPAVIFGQQRHPIKVRTMHVRTAAVLPTNARSLQLRLLVNGQPTIVTEHS